jgi:phage shock protein PspC (stress-responsive transcriptional regulator)
MASKSSWFVVGVIAGLAAAAVGQELAKAPDDRTWKGTIAGVPYNFRLDEWPAVTNEYWNPDSDKVLVPHAIGLGWGINFAALKGRVESLLGVSATTSEAEPRQPVGV